MECKQCGIRKLSSEFPKKRLSNTCKHCPSWCLKMMCCSVLSTTSSELLRRAVLAQGVDDEAKCVVNTGGNYCYDDECNSRYDAEVLDDLRYHLNLITQADVLKPPPATTTTITRSLFSSYNHEITFKVSLLGGDSKECTKSTNTTVDDLMKHLAREFNLPTEYQRLLFNGQQVKKYIDGSQAQLQDYNIAHGSSLQLMKMLLSVTQDTPYKNIAFHLTYGRGTRMQFLDASCFAYRGTTLHGIADFKHTHALDGIAHSGPAQSSGRQFVQVRLDGVSTTVTHLFFVMSACHVGTLREFSQPTVSLYETTRPREQISSYSFTERGNSQAVIMCCMRRTDVGWEAFALGQATQGYCYNYYPIQSTITRLFDNGTV